MSRIAASAFLVFTCFALGTSRPASAGEEEGYRYSIDWTTVNTDSWMSYLGDLAGAPETRGLEIGCFEGRSTLWFLDNIATHADSRMACVDVFTDEIEANFDHNVKVAKQGDRVIKYKGYSQDVLRKLEYDSFDFVYIDGCHLASCALTDAVLSWDLLRAGGFMIFDDYGLKIDEPPSQRPKTAIDAFIAAFADQIHVREIGSQVILEKKGNRSEEELVGKPLVHDPKWLESLRRLSEQKERKGDRAR